LVDPFHHGTAVDLAAEIHVRGLGEKTQGDFAWRYLIRIHGGKLIRCLKSGRGEVLDEGGRLPMAADSTINPSLLADFGQSLEVKHDHFPIEAATAGKTAAGRGYKGDAVGALQGP
jgi:hypothetical protein